MSGEGVNVPLLRKAVEWAEAEAAKCEDGLWDQTSWMATPEERVKRGEIYPSEVADCGTVYCIAGYVACAIGGARVVVSCGTTAGGEHVAQVAADALGIDPPRSRVAPEEGHLFHGENSIADVRRIAEDLAGERL